MLQTWKTLFALFTHKERQGFTLLLVSTSILALLDVVGVASVMPFIAVVVNPEIISSNTYLQLIYTTFNFSGEREFLMALGLFAFSALLLSNSLSMLDAWYSLRFWYNHEYQLSSRLLRTYLDKPYSFLLQKNSAELGRVVLSEVDRAVYNVLMHSMEIFSSLLAVLLLIILIVFIDPWVAIVTLSILGLVYTSVFLFLKRRIKTLGNEYASDESEMYRRTREALEGAKEVKLRGREREFSDRYAKPKYRATRNAIQYDLLNLFPETILETLAFGGIILLVVYLTSVSYGSENALSLVALYAFAAYRMMPALKEVFDGIEKLHFHTAALQGVLDDISGIQTAPLNTRPTPLKLSKQLELHSISYRYPGASQQALINITTRILAKETTCLMGISGAGKSTAMDLMLGLLEPETGNITIDGVRLSSDNVRAWQQNIGYVTNVSFLTDDSIADNIAFGVPTNEINHDRIRTVAQIANVDEFVQRELPAGYETRVGEQGIKLSTGQRQRIGIARALYHDPDLLLLDEATNSLDVATERQILDGLFELRPRKTIIIISHRPWLADLCDTVLIFDAGTIVSTQKR